MAAYGNVAAPQYGQQAAYGATVPSHAQAPAAPAGTFVPGTKIQVGSHRVVIQKYLSEGGFAHVYLVKLPRPVDGTDLAVLKRVAVPDKEALRGMRNEVETIKRVRGHRKVVTYIDSHASELKGGGYEVFLLMEYCNGGGLIDFMNTRLQHRLTEPEILHIFTDVAEGVACMHYLKPPLLHRDLKVENVLITVQGAKKTFKLCDFGSAAPPRPAPQSIVECRLMDEDVQRHTTMQYRSPEMVDVYRKQPIDEKSDIWALGVFLYKLCYYTTPFEDQGQLAILNASYRFPSYPVFSDRLKQLIVLREGCLMMGREVPIKDIYSGRVQQDPTGGDGQPVSDQKGPGTLAVGAVYSPPPVQPSQPIPDIVPMRRGRPAATSQASPAQATRPSPSPMRVTSGDPFAALDSKPSTQVAADELSSRFPTLDQFALLHDQRAKFDFDNPTSPPANKDLSQRVADHLADDAFAKVQPKLESPQPSPRHSTDFSRVKTVISDTERQPLSPPPGPINTPASVPPHPRTEMSRASVIISSNPELQAISSSPPKSSLPPPNKVTMVSTATMTTDSPPLPERPPQEYPQIHRFPQADHDQRRTSSLPSQQESMGTGQLRMDAGYSNRPAPTARLSSFQHSGHVRHSSSSRPSLEGSRPSLEMLEPLSKSASGRPRPASTYLESNLEYLREREAAPRPLRSPGLPSTRFPDKPSSPGMKPQEDTAIESNVDFLRSMEDSDPKRKDKVGKHMKRSSLSSLAGTKNILAGKFGDAFKRFEGNSSNPLARTPSPLKELEHRDLTPIAGSEATDDRSDDGHALGEPEMTPEMRRELEAKSLAEEERRVEAAAAEYRQRVAARAAGDSAPLPKSIGGVSRAQSIQARVQNLLDETQKTPLQKTASGYGRFVDAAPGSDRAEEQPPGLPPRPTGTGRAVPLRPAVSGRPAAAAQDTDPACRPAPPPKPQPAPKPTHLNKIPTGGRPRSPPRQQQRPPPSEPQAQGMEQQLVGVGIPERLTLEMTPQEKEDYIQDFSKRFPSLSAIEMVELDLDVEGGAGNRNNNSSNKAAR
ncbi:hypothetical protein DL767_010176 [Monosporascus sp. MG133]|nr:hypothetical protein DL767_010176 [Monosporascus sp. MG133]